MFTPKHLRLDKKTKIIYASKTSFVYITAHLLQVSFTHLKRLLLNNYPKTRRSNIIYLFGFY
jgi:hypothetical protein